MIRIIAGFACIGLSVPAVTQSDPYFLPSDRVAVQRMDTLIVIPSGERPVSLQAVGGIDVALVEFSPERR